MSAHLARHNWLRLTPHSAKCIVAYQDTFPNEHSTCRPLLIFSTSQVHHLPHLPLEGVLYRMQNGCQTLNDREVYWLGLEIWVNQIPFLFALYINEPSWNYMYNVDWLSFVNLTVKYTCHLMTVHIKVN